FCPQRARYAFQDKKSSALVAVLYALPGSTSHSSSSHCENKSSAAKYSFVAASITGLLTKPSRCQSRHPSIIHRKMAGCSASSFWDSFGSGLLGLLRNGISL